MSTLLQIDEPAARPAPSWRALFELAFRPLYLAGAAWALLSVLVWVFAPHWLGGPLGGLAWHAHEMLWGFVATIAVGFLLTAGANWTGQVPLAGHGLSALLALWLVARGGYLVGGTAAFVAAAAAEALFFLVAAAAMGRVVWRTRNRRNYAVPAMMLALGATHLLFVASLDDWPRTLLGFNAGLLVMAMIALLVARRVIPFFAMRAVPNLKIPMHEASARWQLAAVLVATMALLAGWALLQAAALALAGALAFWQLLGWRPLAVRSRPILWILYAGYAGLAAGLLAAAAQAAGAPWRSALPVHLIAMAGFSVLIIGMVTRTALGHLGRKLVLDRSMVASYGLVLAAVALRLAALWPSPASAGLLQGAALAWAAAFAAYLWRFTPWMIRARPDAPPPNRP
ncbi:MAG: NnrS family protein [Rubrivivax sp.]|nr:NnrS family protein [Rubrivivax sp.]